MPSNFERDPSHSGPTPRFASKIHDAMKVVKTILDNTRNPSLASPDHVHTYNDKYTLSEFVTNIALAALLNVLDKMGLGKVSATTATDFSSSGQVLQKLGSIVQDERKSVTMRFIARETCAFVKQEETEVDGSSYSVATDTEVTSTQSDGEKTPKSETKSTKSVLKVVQKEKKFYWKVEIEYGIFLYCGDDANFTATTSVPIVRKTVSTEVITMTSNCPFLTTVDTQPLDVDLTWLIQNVDKETLATKFKIDRDKESCRTPRNNDDSRQAWDFFYNIGVWFTNVSLYLTRKDDEIYYRSETPRPRERKAISSIHRNNIFVPVLPIFESSSMKESDGLASTNASPMSPILPAKDVNQFLQKQYLTMTESVDNTMSHFSSEPFMSSVEASIVLLTKHAFEISDTWSQGINYIEDMLCTQLYDAIGKHVTCKDLDEFVHYHNQKLFSDTYAPEPFCYAIRRPDHYPDGTVSIEELGAGVDGKQNINKHAMTFTRQLETSDGEYPMNIPINSATSIEFNGDLFLHAWMLQRFKKKPSFQLVSRARQFSSFLLLIGKLSGPNTFEPEHGIILQNKDEILIPLIMEEMPSAKEFKDAISSLSPEQQRFAKAFRSMKLSSSVFGVCVVQLKPQLEILLGLPEKSLTKEIRLTQDLLSLFIEYQIPSDLLSFDGDDELEASAKVEIVKGYVKNVQSMIDDLKKRDLKEAGMEADMAYEQREGMLLGSTSAGLFGAPAPAPPDFSFGSSTLAHTAAFSSGPSTLAPSAAYGAEVAQKERSAPKFKKSARTMVKGSSSKPRPPPPHGSSATQSGTQNIQQRSNVIQQSSEDGKCTDLTAIPNVLDSKFEIFGADERYGGALRSTIIKTSENWTKKHKQNLLSKMQKSSLTSDEKEAEHNKAFDLLDALSRSGVLPMSHSEMHIVIASTHCFDKSVVNTVIQDNVNPIEKIERSNLLVASIIHDVGMNQLLSEVGELERISNHSPMLLN